MSTKILYAEDELFLGKIVMESLESRNYEVIMEPDGNKVLALFIQHRPDICVLDIMLPNMINALETYAHSDRQRKETSAQT